MEPEDLPFTSFCQESIPLRLQYKKLPEERQERQERLRQERQKQVQQQQQKRPQRRSQNQRFREPAAKYSPQPSSCRHYNENFSSKNALFRHLNLCKTSRSRASSIRVSRAPSKSSASVSSRVSRASLVSTTSSAILVLSTLAITLIENV
jgi:hypothetical protein